MGYYRSYTSRSYRKSYRPRYRRSYRPRYRRSYRPRYRKRYYRNKASIAKRANRALRWIDGPKLWDWPWEVKRCLRTYKCRKIWRRMSPHRWGTP